MKIEARFVASAFSLEACPRWGRAEVALAGRSNVGKSSLLNALAGAGKLARTSKTPGRTRCLNFYTFGASLALVDLPGFGYAKIPRSEAEKIARLMRAYLERRANLAALVMLVDARHGPRNEEVMVADLIRRRGLGLMIVATKCDKLRRCERSAALNRFKTIGVDPILCSVNSGEGLDELRRRVAEFAPAHGAHAASETSNARETL
jgi:GTP-binding protein